MSNRVLFLFLFITLLSGCSSSQVEDERGQNLPGSDRDSYGCIGSAGYAWCEHTQQCERPWILADEKGFKDTAEAFEKYCSQ